MSKRWPVEKVVFVLLLAIFFVGSLLRTTFVDFADVDYGVYSDHFINAVTAKNIAQGRGWSSSGYETYLLNPENLTTGPTVVVPAAAAVALFGNLPAVPGLALFAVNAALFAGLLLLLKKLYPREQYFALGTLLLSFFICFKSYYWYRMTGEMPALLLLLIAIAALRLYSRLGRVRDLFFVALALTFAQGAKELTLLPSLMLGAVATVITIRQKPLRECVVHLPLFWLVLFSLPGGFALYCHHVIRQQPEDWQQAYAVYAQGLHDYYSGMATLREYFSQSPVTGTGIFRRVFSGALWNGGTLLHLSFAGLRGIQYWLLIYSSLGVMLVLNRRATLPALLALASAPLLVWYFAVAEHAMPRHLYIGLSLAALALVFFVAAIDDDAPRRFASLVVVALLVYTGDLSSRLALVSWPLHDSPALLAMQDIEQRVEQLPPKSLYWFGMVDNNEFEFLSRRPDNFSNVYDRIAEGVELDEGAYLAAHPGVSALIESHRVGSARDYYVSRLNRHSEAVPVRFIHPVSFDWLHIKATVASLHPSGTANDPGQFCRTVIYQNDYYMIEHCDTDDITALFASAGGMPLRPRLWTPWIKLPFERTEILY